MRSRNLCGYLKKHRNNFIGCLIYFIIFETEFENLDFEYDYLGGFLFKFRI